MRKIISFGLLFSIVALAGCEKWVKPGATEQDYEAADASCNNQANMRFPRALQMVPISNGYVVPATTTCDQHHHSTTCTSYPAGYIPPDYGAVDANADARWHFVRDCLFQNGWRLE